MFWWGGGGWGASAEIPVTFRIGLPKACGFEHSHVLLQENEVCGACHIGQHEPTADTETETARIPAGHNRAEKQEQVDQTAIGAGEAAHK